MRTEPGETKPGASEAENTGLELKIRRYARLLLTCGIQLQPGQPLCVEASEAAADFVALLKEEAATYGGDVLVVWQEKAPDMERVEDFVRREAGFIRRESPSNKPVREDGSGKGQKPQIPVRSLFRTRARNGGQTVACVPCESWAGMVFPGLPPEQGMRKLWNAVLSCTRCDIPDPSAAWNAYIEEVTARKQWLDEKNYQEFHYSGKGTELTIRPAEGDFWKGGCVKTPGRVSIPNIPTQEVFISPHKYSAEGHVAATMPVNYGGNLIEGIELDLKDGRIVSCKAAKNQQLLEEIIATDEGSHYFGEMALVDQSNPIASMGLLFYTTLYDENASCHIAVGSTIGPPFDPEEKERRGFNQSAVHMDFMVGSKELNIRGRKPDGTWEDILRGGRLIH